MTNTNWITELDEAWQVAQQEEDIWWQWEDKSTDWLQFKYSDRMLHSQKESYSLDMFLCYDLHITPSLHKQIWQ